MMESAIEWVIQGASVLFNTNEISSDTYDIFSQSRVTFRSRIHNFTYKYKKLLNTWKREGEHN
jgi:hypothetical protein